jgi:hypothetical protein
MIHEGVFHCARDNKARGELYTMIKTAVPVLLALGGLTVYAQGRPAVQIHRNAVIDSPGTYVLSSDLTVSGSEPALTIRASNVTVDLGGHEIAGPGRNAGTGILIDSSTGVRVFNGNIRDLGMGVTVMSSNAVRLEGLIISGRGIAVSAPPPEVGVMIVNSRSVVVAHNNMFGIGLGVFVRGPGSMGNHIHDNTITASANGLLGVCYNPAPGQVGGPRGDTVERNTIYGFRFGIQVNAGMPNVFRQNVLFYTMGAFEVGAGLTVQDIDNVKVQLP